MFSCQASQRGAHQMHQTRCSHAATQGQLCQRACAGPAAAEGTGTCPGGCSKLPAPQSAWHVPPCPAAHTVSRCVQKPGAALWWHSGQQPRTILKEEGDRSSDRSNARSIRKPGDCVHRSKHQPGEVGPRLSSAIFDLQLDSRVFSTLKDSDYTTHICVCPLCSPSSPSPQALPQMQNRVQEWVLPAPTATICSRPVLLCWAETSGPIGCVPGHRARAPSTAAPALGRALQPASSCSSVLIPAREIIYLFKNVFSQETSPVLRDIFNYKEQINSLSLQGPDALQTPVLNPGLALAAVWGQHCSTAGSLQRPHSQAAPCQRGTGATQPVGAQGTGSVGPTEAAQHWDALGVCGSELGVPATGLPPSGDQQGWRGFPQP